MHTTRKAILPLVIAATLFTTPVTLYAKAKPIERPQTQEQVSMALGFVEKLLSVSSLAQTIEKTQFPPAMAYLTEARRLHGQALIDLEQNNLVAALAKRDEAIRLAFEAGHLSHMANGRKEQGKKDYEDRLRSIQALSKAYASIVTKSGKGELVEQLHQQIDGHLTEAESYRAKGDFIKGLQALLLAYEKTRSAVESVRGGQTLGASSQVSKAPSKRLRDYKTKLRSINALLAAQQRIADEKASPEQKQQMKRTVSALLNSAKDYANANDYELAINTINQAYKIITASIEQLRGGETLVRTLKFETPEEEYHYELDRNNTYKMLIHSLVKDKKTMHITERVQQFLDEAEALRKLGERQARDGDFDAAIASMEKSTRNLIFAMRNAGFFIPG